MDEIMLKVDNVSKKYKLGQIGGTTLRDELQRLGAKLRHKEDPTQKIGAKSHTKNETFMALNGVSFEVKKGERVGIIGHNGAGKSTLLKLISRITAPTGGTISMNGRVASMLEVGTGFNGELTGRENIYMNGAILGMTKKEIDAKIEDIIEFSECRQFIDTPVKRYSSGMYVKLAFSVAAHLDSEIMIMDEVLAVGDLAFQKKCLDKMNAVSRDDGRTILYVSHNMDTIRQLCNRVIVLNKGLIVFDGEVEKGIINYQGHSEASDIKITFDPQKDIISQNDTFQLKSFEFLGSKNNAIYEFGEKIEFRLQYSSLMNLSNLVLAFVIYSQSGTPVTMMHTNRIQIGKTVDGYLCGNADISLLAPGIYTFELCSYEVNDYGGTHFFDIVKKNVLVFEVCGNQIHNFGRPWNSSLWGYMILNNLEIGAEIHHGGTTQV